LDWLAQGVPAYPSHDCHRWQAMLHPPVGGANPRLGTRAAFGGRPALTGLPTACMDGPTTPRGDWRGPVTRTPLPPDCSDVSYGPHTARHRLNPRKGTASPSSSGGGTRTHNMRSL